jgi:hypothetical protein
LLDRYADRLGELLRPPEEHAATAKANATVGVP